MFTTIRVAVVLALTAFLIACGGGGGSAGTSSTGGEILSTNTVTASVSSVAISSSISQINANNSDATTIVVTALNANNALVPGALISISADTGVLSASTGTTDANGQASFRFSAGSLNQINRTALITAALGTKSAQTSIKIVGGTITIDAMGVSTIVLGSSLTLSATLRDASGAPVSNAALTLSSSSPNVVSSSLAMATTNVSGIASFSLFGLTSGSSLISIAGNGIVANKSISVTAPGAGFFFLSPSPNSIVSTGTGQNISVQAGTATQVQFVTTLGTFSNASSAQLVAVSNGVANAVLTMPSAGQATVNAINAGSSAVSATLAISASPPVSSANKILLTASRNNVPISSTGSLNTIQLKARAIFNSGGIDASVFNVPILFSISGGPGAGEYLSSAIVYTNASGEAITDFVAGTQATTQNGVTVKAQVLGTTVATGVLPSGNDSLLTVGGQALSVAFSPATVITSSTDNTYYELGFSALVSGAGGSAVAGEVVSLNVKPYAFSFGGSACTANSTTTFTFCSEDRNGNGSLDAGEDGIRISLPFGLNPISCTSPSAFGISNSQLTPPTAAAGTVPGAVVTNGAGIASFTLTYLKSSAIWVVVELTATVSSSGTEAKSSSIFRLSPSVPDASDPTNCPLPPSPYAY